MHGFASDGQILATVFEIDDEILRVTFILSVFSLCVLIHAI